MAEVFSFWRAVRDLPLESMYVLATGFEKGFFGTFLDRDLVAMVMDPC